MASDFLRKIKCFLLDMDGTLYLGEELLPGVKDFISLLNQMDIQFFCLTNNSSRSRKAYAEKIQRLGLDISLEQIISSGEATASYLVNKDMGRKIFLVGTPSLEREFEEHGFELVQLDPDLVVIGFDTTLTYAKLERLCHLVRTKIPFIATHSDINCPTEHGPIPDIGAMLALVRTSTGREPDEIIGKPHKPILDVILSRTGLHPHQLCMVGDRLYTDVAMGRHGIRTVLVLSGETRQEDLADSPFEPDLVLDGIASLAAQMEDLS
jgi:phosphoglycolate/pyridoxal phosphate phosphatase family enzyme